MYTISKIDAMPELDPWSRIHATIPTLVLDCEGGTVSFKQEVRDNSTTFARFHGRELSWAVEGFPKESAVRELIDDVSDALNAILAGYTSDYRNGDLIGHLTDEALDAVAEIDNAVGGLYLPQWNPMNIEDFADDSDFAGMDETQIVEELMAYAADEDIVWLGDVERYASDVAYRRLLQTITWLLS